jgi:hypothetical protein
VLTVSVLTARLILRGWALALLLCFSLVHTSSHNWALALLLGADNQSTTCPHGIQLEYGSYMCKQGSKYNSRVTLIASYRTEGVEY